MPTAFTLDATAAIDRLMRFLAVEGVTGQEAAIGREIVKALKEAGVPGSAIRFDDANTRIPEPTQTGNLIVKLPGTSKKAAKPILFMTHMDTVPLCAGAKPKLQGNRIVNEANAALGGDNRTGCTCSSRSRPNSSPRSCRIRRSRCSSPCGRNRVFSVRSTSTRRTSAGPSWASTSTAVPPRT